MFKWLTAKIDAAIKHWQGEHFDLGYQWAAGALLSGKYSRVQVIDCVEIFNQSAFDKGMLAALNDYNKLLEEPAP